MAYIEYASQLVPGAVVWSRTESTRPVGSDALILPDGCMDLIWFGDELVVAGPDAMATQVEARPNSSYVGLRLPPGVLPVVLGMPADELRDRRVSAADIMGEKAVRRLRSRVVRHESVFGRRVGMPGADRPVDVAGRARASVLEGYCSVALPEPWIAPTVRRLAAGRSVADAADALGWTVRSLHRRSVAAFGYGPKRLAMILRMQRALRLADTEDRWGSVAAEAGYVDQAHLCRDMRTLTGRSPGQLFAERLERSMSRSQSAAKTSTLLPSGSTTEA